jgi:hypothetical protein
VHSRGKEMRRHSGTDDRAQDEPHERERGRDDPAPVAAGGRQADDRNDDPVDLGDGAVVLRAEVLPSTWRAWDRSRACRAR